MASGIIYLAIIGMWAAYFLPRWVHDRNEFSGKSVERYKSALRIVASSSPGGSSGTGVIHTDLDHEAKIAQLLMRRRIIFSLITISFTMTIVGAMMQTLAISFIGIPVLGFVLYLAYVRQDVGGFKITTQDLVSNESKVISNTGSDESPSFSPNSDMIAYSYNDYRGGTIAVLSRNGRAFTKLNISGDVRDPAWGPLVGTQ